MRNTVVTVTSLLILSMTWKGRVEGAVPPCNQTLFSANVNHLCMPNFSRAMAASSYRQECPWPAMKGTYNQLSRCIDDWANWTVCSGWKSVLEDIYMDIHNEYFSACKVPLQQDPPLTTMVLLISPGVIFTLFLPLLCLHLTTYKREMPGTLGL